MAKASNTNKPRINTLSGDRARLAERAYQERSQGRQRPSGRSRPATATSGGSGKPPARPSGSAPSAAGRSNVPATRRAASAARTIKDMGVAERVKNTVSGYVRNSTASARGSISSAVRDFKRSPTSALVNRLKSIPHGRKIAAVLGLSAVTAGAGYAARQEAESRRPTQTRRDTNRDTSGDDVPLIEGTNDDATIARARQRDAQRQASQRQSTSGRRSNSNYPVYPKNSSQAASFRSAFAAARKAGKAVFEWEGRKYNTKLKGEK